MQIVIGGHSDIGSSRQTNQDSLFIKLAGYGENQICIGAVCDGVGGLQDGELASVLSTLLLRQWFDRLLEEPPQGIDPLKQGLLDCMHHINQRITEYSKERGIHTGTTLSVFLATGQRFVIAHIGDSRIYKVDGGLYQLTMDHTTTQLRSRAGAMVPKRLLTQCVGYRDELAIFCQEGWVKPQEVYLLCSDGFYTRMREGEILTRVKKIKEKTDLDAIAKQLIDGVIRRKESDNVSLGIIKFI